jgi:hypothetical protein
MNPTKPRRSIHAVILRLFILLNLTSIFLYGMPSCPSVQFPRQKLRWYVRSVGLDQAWNMFAPNPADTDCEFFVRGTLRDQTSFEWKLPRYSRTDLLHEIVFERGRKFEERVRLDKNKAIWPSVANRIANRIALERGELAEISLVRRWVKVETPYGLKPLSAPKEYVFYTKNFLVNEEKKKQ